MQETCTKDPAIKLFGKKIPLLVDVDRQVTKSGAGLPELERQKDEWKSIKDCPSPGTKVSADTKSESSQEDTTVNPKTPSISEDSLKSKDNETEKEPKDATNSQLKTPKKPDKVLPCPRCNSMDTKFCYYNNYNVNQPRHFCRACQRYWTNGGTMRNVPVGAGRRKNKSSASHYRHITISEALEAARIEYPNGAHLPAFKGNGKVLSFGFDVPICDSMTSVLNLVDKKALNGTQNGFHKFEEPRILIPSKGVESGDDCLTGSSSVTISNSNSNSLEKEAKNGSHELTNVNGFSSPIPCLPAVSWPHPWNPVLPSTAAFGPPAFPMSFYPAPYWNCGVAWNMPLLSPQSACSSSNSLKLGKHSREIDTNKLDELDKDGPSKHKNGGVLVPKVLRLDDPNNAAKSSIWTTLGIKNESLPSGALLNGFQLKKGSEKDHAAETMPSMALKANPAALSRSLNFHEIA